MVPHGWSARVVTGGLADLWKQKGGDKREYDRIRGWVTNLTDKDWQQALPAGSSLTPTEMRLIWQSFSGGR